METSIEKRKAAAATPFVPADYEYDKAEKVIINKINRRVILRDVFDQRIALIKEYIEKSGSGVRPQEDHFEDLYSAAEIAKDKKYVQDMEGRFDADLKKLSPLERTEQEANIRRSDAMEMIVYECGESYDWFGANAKTSRTARFDDIKKGIDEIIEYENEGGDEDKEIQRLALTIDVTSSTNDTKIMDKIKDNAKKITNNNLDEVKYYHSEIEDRNLCLKNAVNVVIGIEGGRANIIILQFADIVELQNKPNRTAEESKALKTLKENFANHPCQRIFLEEIKLQLEAFAELAEKKPITDILGTINGVIEEKQNLPLDQNDEVFTSIKKNTAGLVSRRKNIN